MAGSVDKWGQDGPDNLPARLQPRPLDLASAPTPLALGCPLLDDLLGGGLPRGLVTEVCGEAGAGKSHLVARALLAAVGPEPPTETPTAVMAANGPTAAALRGALAIPAPPAAVLPPPPPPPAPPPPPPPPPAPPAPAVGGPPKRRGLPPPGLGKKQRMTPAGEPCDGARRARAAPVVEAAVSPSPPPPSPLHQRSSRRAPTAPARGSWPRRPGSQGHRLLARVRRSRERRPLGGWGRRPRPWRRGHPRLCRPHRRTSPHRRRLRPSTPPPRAPSAAQSSFSRTAPLAPPCGACPPSPAPWVWRRRRRWGGSRFSGSTAGIRQP